MLLSFQMHERSETEKNNVYGAYIPIFCAQWL